MSDFLSSYDSCPICYDDYMETPKALPCLHSFCQKCLQAYISSNAKRNPDGWYVHCPVCRSISLPPNKDCTVGNGAAAFPTNFYINRRRSSLLKRRKIPEKAKMESVASVPTPTKSRWNGSVYLVRRLSAASVSMNTRKMTWSVTNCTNFTTLWHCLQMTVPLLFVLITTENHCLCSVLPA